MKCEKCNKNKATFYYKATINGKTTEKHLCADCAREEGFQSAFESQSGFFDDMLGGFFGRRDPFFGDFFGGGLLPGFTRTMLAPMLTLPRIEFGFLPQETERAEAARTEEKPAEQPQEKNELNTRRELNALRHQLKEAVRAEDYEKAIELRDKIKALDK